MALVHDEPEVRDQVNCGMNGEPGDSFKDYINSSVLPNIFIGIVPKGVLWKRANHHWLLHSFGIKQMGKQD